MDKLFDPLFIILLSSGVGLLCIASMATGGNVPLAFAKICIYKKNKIAEKRQSHKKKTQRNEFEQTLLYARLYVMFFNSLSIIALIIACIVFISNYLHS